MLENIKTKKRILFTGGGGAGTEALSKLLEKKYEVYFADADMAARPYPISVDHWLQIPLATAKEFTGEIKKLCRRLKIDLLIPTVDEELLEVARLAKPIGFDVLLPPERFVERHLDKLVSNQFLRHAGLQAPKTVAVDQGRLDFPCIIKPRFGRGSRNVAIVSSEKELQAQITLARKKPKDFVVQEKLEGTEYTVMMASDRNGELRGVVPVLLQLKRGITLRGVTKYDQDIIHACQAIHASDPIPGCYNIQLIKDTNNLIMPFEINPRISTTACLGYAAGVDFIGIYFENPEKKNHQFKKLLNFKNNLWLKRSWYNEITESGKY